MPMVGSRRADGGFAAPEHFAPVDVPGGEVGRCTNVIAFDLG
jgi:hypothetical protein